MKVVSTPMCQDILRFAGLSNYIVTKNLNSTDAELAVTLYETETNIQSIKIKLNTYSQIYNSIMKISRFFNTKSDEIVIKELQDKINYIHNLKKLNQKRKIKVIVYSNFIKDIVEDMGFIVREDNNSEESTPVVFPDYLEDKLNFYPDENTILLPSHKNVPKNPLERAELRYNILEKKLCMKP
ncbi:MAG: hypothetical protein ACP5C3_02270 [Methanomicrobiales archaeon]